MGDTYPVYLKLSWIHCVSSVSGTFMRRLHMTSVSSVSIWKKGGYTMYLVYLRTSLTLCISHLGQGCDMVPDPCV